MRLNLISYAAVAAVLLVAAACSRSTTAARRAAEVHPVSVVGCVQQGRTSDDLVIVGRSVGDSVTTATGTQGGGGIPSTTTLRGGDGDRLPSNGTREDWASKLSPKLIGGDRNQLRSAVGHMILVLGQYLPASKDDPQDELQVTSIEPISDTCTAP